MNRFITSNTAIRIIALSLCTLVSVTSQAENTLSSTAVLKPGAMDLNLSAYSTSSDFDYTYVLTTQLWHNSSKYQSESAQLRYGIAPKLQIGAQVTYASKISTDGTSGYNNAPLSYSSDRSGMYSVNANAKYA